MRKGKLKRCCYENIICIGKENWKSKKNMTVGRNKSVEREERKKQEEIRWLFIIRVLLPRFHLLAENPRIKQFIR